MLTPGQELGGYRIIEPLEPKSSSLWSARSPNGEPVCLRVVQVFRDQEATLREKLTVDLDVACRAHHPNLLITQDAGIEDGWHYVVQEPIEGILLGRLLQDLQGVWPSAGLSGYIAHQVARALEYLHALPGPSGEPLGHLSHELSPDHIVLERSGRVKLAQVITAERRQDLVNTAGQETHSPIAYLSPEVAAQAGHDGRSDMFSLGVVLWELLAQERLFRQESDIETLKAIQTAEVPPLEDGIPKEIATLTLRCLAKEPQGRFTDMTALIAALQHSLQGMSNAGVKAMAEFVGMWESAKYPKRRTAMLSEASQVPRASDLPNHTSTEIAVPTPDLPDQHVDPFYDPIRDGATSNSRFEFLGRLGSGGMGEVYRVRDHELEEIVALKRIPKNSGPEAQSLERLKREVRLARRIASDHVCRIFDIVDLGDGDRGLTMSLIDGVTLADILKMGVVVSYPRFARWAADIADGLAAAHTLNIVHRDLKPENIMIRENDRAVILDFGIARAKHEGDEDESVQLTQAGIIMGTPMYMSPEQLSNRPLDGRSDLYSLGLILAELITSEVPLSGNNYSEILEQRVIRGGRFHLQDVDPGAPPVLAQLNDQLLEPAADDRPQKAEAIKTAFENYIASSEATPAEMANTALVTHIPAASAGSPGAEAVTVIPQPLSRPAPSRDRRQIWLASAIALMIVTLVLLGVYVNNTSKANPSDNRNPEPVHNRNGASANGTSADGTAPPQDAGLSDAGAPDRDAADAGIPDSGVKKTRPRIRRKPNNIAPIEEM